MQALIEVILPVFLVIGAGHVAVRAGWFSEAGVDGLMTFTQNFAIPCLLFVAIAGLDLGQSFDWRLLLAFYAGALAGFLLGLLARGSSSRARGRMRSPSASAACFPTPFCSGFRSPSAPMARGRSAPTTPSSRCTRPSVTGWASR